MKGYPYDSDLNADCCPVCNFRYSPRWVEYVIAISKEGARQIKRKFAGVVLPCPECLPPVVIPKVYR